MFLLFLFSHILLHYKTKVLKIQEKIIDCVTEVLMLVYIGMIYERKR